MSQLPSTKSSEIISIIHKMDPKIVKLLISDSNPQIYKQILKGNKKKNNRL